MPKVYFFVSFLLLACTALIIRLVGTDVVSVMQMYGATAASVNLYADATNAIIGLFWIGAAGMAAMFCVKVIGNTTRWFLYGPLES